MNLRTLVLNAFWVPIRQEHWRKAFVKTISERAEVLEYYEVTVRSSSKEFFVPAVIRLQHYNRIPKFKLTYSRKAVFVRDKYKCQYCTQQLTPNSVTIDHILPRSKGGKTTFKNTVTSCFKCNNKKGRKLLSESKMKLKSKPVAPKQLRYKPKLGALEEEWRIYVRDKI